MASISQSTNIAEFWAGDSPLHHKLIGGFLIGVSITTWISSIASPFIFVISLWQGYYITASLTITITIAAYMPWERGTISRYLRRLYRTYYPTYFSNGAAIVIEKPDATEKQTQCFYAVHPHGAFCVGWAVLFYSSVLEHVRFCFSPVLFASPFVRLLTRILGKPGSAARDAMSSYMKDGESVAILIGGFEEATLTSTSVDRVFIKKRTGFVKLCLKYGVPIRPVYAFGERKVYSNVQGLWKLRFKLNRYGIPTILPWGELLVPFLPKSRNVKLHVVIGETIKLPKIENPSKDEVKLWHGRYIKALVKLFESHKEDAYGHDEGKAAKLEVW